MLFRLNINKWLVLSYVYIMAIFILPFVSFSKVNKRYCKDTTLFFIMQQLKVIYI